MTIRIRRTGLLSDAIGIVRMADWSIAVSYTHLDVYKRQGYILSEKRTGDIPSDYR